MQLWSNVRHKSSTGINFAVNNFLRNCNLWDILIIPLIILGNPILALLSGASIALLSDLDPRKMSGGISKYSLQAAIVLLGFQFGFDQIIQIGESHALLVVAYVPLAIIVGATLGYFINQDQTSRQLITHGTAICGGTTIVSLSAVIKANHEQTAVALALVFILNAVALFAFPFIGEIFGLSEEQFGLWAALAIHDTSSVLATSSLYGEEALAVATTTKLIRTLWLIPLLLVVSVYQGVSKRLDGIPWFIVLFCLAAGSNYVIDLPESFLKVAPMLSKALIIVALFYIGTSITRKSLKSLRGPIAAHAILLWATLVVITFIWIYYCY